MRWWRSTYPGRTGRGLTLILVVGLGLRLAWVFFASRPPVGPHDPTLYLLYGSRIASGRGYSLPNGLPTAYYPVGYPAVIGLVLWLVRSTPLPNYGPGAVAALQVVLGMATVVLVFHLARRLAGPRVALVAASFMALFPNLIFHSAAILGETLFLFLLMAFLWVLIARPWSEGGMGGGADRGAETTSSASISAPRIEAGPPLDKEAGPPFKRGGMGGGAHPGTWRLMGAGLVLGLATLVRPQVIVVLLPLLLIGRGAWGMRVALTRVALVLATAVVVAAPWAVRNLMVMDGFVLISTNLGDDLCIGHTPGGQGRFSLSDYCFANRSPDRGPGNEPENDRGSRARALEFMAGHPVEELLLIPKKAFWMLHEDHDGLDAVESFGDDLFVDVRFARPFLDTTADAFFYAILGLGLVAAPAFARGSPERRLFLWASFALLIAPLAFFGDPRFHVPAVPLLSVMAAFTVVSAREGWQARAPGSGDADHLGSGTPTSQREAVTAPLPSGPLA